MQRTMVGLLDLCSPSDNNMGNAGYSLCVITGEEGNQQAHKAQVWQCSSLDLLWAFHVLRTQEAMGDRVYWSVPAVLEWNPNKRRHTYRRG